ncbi:MAG: glycoside hydrolase family 3 N-terminal domain-containing protein [Pseudomonadota bacterium]
MGTTARWVGVLCAATMALAPVEATGQVRIPRPPIDGLILRAPDFQIVPRVRPTLAATFETTCKADDPDLLWAKLPRTLREVPLRQMIGQLLVVSYGGNTENARGVGLAADALRRSAIGGVLTFRHNVKSADDIAAINTRLSNAHPVLPAFVAVDQEGGFVARIKESEGAPKIPTAKDMASRTPLAAKAAYRAMAEHLATLGFTVNFGPVVDLAVNPDNPVIARFGRAYGKTAQTVVTYATGFVEAHREAGLSTALKHFPGHGASTGDSHLGVTDVSGKWTRNELLPFQTMIENGKADMVMMGHLMLDGVTGPDDRPASLSPNAIEGLLRGTLCYAGLVVSDDLTMDAIEDRFGIPEAARLMLEAGGDIALISLPAEKGMGLVKEVTDHLEAAAKADPALAYKIRRAYARVVNHKLDMSDARDAAPGTLTAVPPTHRAGLAPDDIVAFAASRLASR